MRLRVFYHNETRGIFLSRLTVGKVKKDVGILSVTT